MTPEEARYAALRELGGVEQIKEECRDMRRVNYLEDFLQDIRYGLRQLRGSPGFTAAATLTLALGIGANTAIFSVVDAVVLRPLPYKDPNRLVMLKESIPLASPDPIPVCAPDVVQFQRQNQVFESVAAFRGGQFDLAGEGEPERITAERINSNLFSLLGVQPLLGRAFTTEEDQPGHSLAILSYPLWQRHFSGNSGVIGRTVTLDRQPYTVIGVMPRNFAFPLRGMEQGDAADVFAPMGFTREELADVGDNFNYSVLARLKPGITLARANADVNAIAYRILQTYPPQFRDRIKLGAVALPLNAQVVGKVRTLLLLLLGAVGFVRQCCQPSSDPCRSSAKGNRRPSGPGGGTVAPASPVGNGKPASGSRGSRVRSPPDLRDHSFDGNADAGEHSPRQRYRGRSNGPRVYSVTGVAYGPGLWHGAGAGGFAHRRSQHPQGRRAERP